MTAPEIIRTETVYYPQESRRFTETTIQLVRSRVEQRPLSAVCVFTNEGEGAIKLAEALSDMHVKVVAVTFPANRYTSVTTGDRKEKHPIGISDEKIVKTLRSLNVEVVRGPMPFEEIIIPRASDPKSAAIRHTFNLFGMGMQLCVQAILIACDAGILKAGDEVASMSADTAIVATASTSTLLFSPYEGLEIREIICKPRVHTLARHGIYGQENP